MAFNFGSTTQNQSGLNFGVGSNQPKPAFGAGSTGFAFGSSAAATPAPTFGSFGTSTASTAPSGTTNFGFGSNFGIPASTTTATFGGLGTTTSTAGGFGSFGTPATSAPSGFSFGAPATTASTFGGFGTLGTNTGPTGTFGGFGATATTTTPTLFSGLGTTTNTAGSTFGGLGSFATKPAGSTFSFGNTLGGTNNLNSSFGNTSTFGNTLGQQQPAKPQQLDQNQIIVNAVLNVKIFGDERDTILAKWNLLQASWGVGKGYYNQNLPPVDFTPENPYCRFKAIAYSAMPGKDNKEGLVVLVFNKKDSELKSQQQMIQTTLSSILGNKPELKVNIEEIKALSDVKAQLTIWIEEKNVMGTSRKIPASDLSMYLNQAMPRQQLSNLCVIKIFPNIRPDSDQLQEYLVHPPSGLDPRIWKQAQEDNPDSIKFIPVPVVGFNQLKWRLQIQENETALHRAYLDRVSEDIAALKQKQAASIAQISEYKRKFFDLQHRVLRVLVKQEMSRKVGMALLPEEEQLRIQLENMQAQISIPTQFRGRLTELLAHIRIQRCGEDEVASTSTLDRYRIDPSVQDDVKQFLLLEQVGINHLIETVNTDLENLNKIKEGMQHILQS